MSLEIRLGIHNKEASQEGFRLDWLIALKKQEEFKLDLYVMQAKVVIYN